MFTRTNQAGFPRLAGSIQSVRFARKRAPEYPSYTMQLAPLGHKSKDHNGVFRRHLKAWLGPKNVVGEYHENKYYYVPQNNVPNYVVPDGNPLVSSTETSNVRGYAKRNPSVNPFPQNPSCKTASMVSDDLKKEIYSDHEKGVLAQELAHKHRMKVARVEAIVRLQKIEQVWKEEVCFFSFCCLLACCGTMMNI